MIGVRVGSGDWRWGCVRIGPRLSPGVHVFGILAADKLADEGLAYINDQPDATLIDRPGLTEGEYADLLRGGSTQ